MMCLCVCMCECMCDGNGRVSHNAKRSSTCKQHRQQQQEEHWHGHVQGNAGAQGTRGKDSQNSKHQTRNEKNKKDLTVPHMKHPSTKARSNMQKQGMERHADDAQTGRCNKHDSQTTCLTLITEQSKNKSSPIHLTPADSKHTGDFIEHHKKKKIKKNMQINEKKKGVGGGEGEVRVCACAKGPCRHPIAPKEQKKERRKELQKGQGHKCKDKATRGQEDEAGGGISKG